MKKLFQIGGLWLSFSVAAFGANVTLSLTPGAAAVAANTTNTTAGTTKDLGSFPPTIATVFLSASGVAATTNGSYTVWLEQSPDGVIWDTAVLSNMKLQMTSLGAATNQVNDWFTINSRFIRAGRSENLFSGAVSNTALTIIYNDGK